MTDSIPMLLKCPECGKRHIDKGHFAKHLHHTHACQFCGHEWRPAIVPTVGVRFLPGHKDEPVDAAPVIDRMVKLKVLTEKVARGEFGPGRSPTMDENMEARRSKEEILKTLPSFLSELEDYLLKSDYQ